MTQTTQETPKAAALLRGCADALLDWLYPRHCYHCEAPIEQSRGHVLCPACYNDLLGRRITGGLCATCGLPLPVEPSGEAMCVSCRLQGRSFDAARAFFAYAGPAASVIKSYKFKGDYFLGPRFLRGLLAQGWLPDGIEAPQAVVPVPLHPRRRRERGYDQALLLARVLAEHFGCQLVRGALVRTRYTSQQALLPVTQRWDNVRGAFAVAKPKLVEGRSLLLVDDVLTTGMTADECAKVLKKSGAARVQVLALARTMP